MTEGDLVSLVLGVLQGLGATTVFVLVLFVGFCVVFGFPKLRPSGRKTKVVRSLGELVGEPATFLPPDAPRGPADQLRTPELIEKGTAGMGA
jgi:hypothetical protein